MITMESIFTKDNMLQATKEVSRKKSAGIDGISAKRAKSVVSSNYSYIYKELIADRYKPNKVILKQIPKENGKFRPIALATTVDRCIQGCLNNSIYPLFESGMSQYSFGFRKGHNCMMAVNQVRKYIEDGHTWIGKIDLSGCFNHINQNKVLFKLRQKIDDERIMNLINKYMKIKYISENDEFFNIEGCPQGSALSPLFTNIVLSDLDKEFERRQYAFARYADDIIIAFKSEKAARLAIEKVCLYIEKKCKLPINQDKVEIKSINEGFCFLGFFLYKNNGIHIVPTLKNWKKLRNKISDVCKNNTDINMINKINEYVRGWICYYLDSEISIKCKKLDLFINKEINKAEKRLNKQIDRSKIISCHEFYKEKRASDLGQGRIHLS